MTREDIARLLRITSALHNNMCELAAWRETGKPPQYTEWKNEGKKVHG